MTNEAGMLIDEYLNESGVAEQTAEAFSSIMSSFIDDDDLGATAADALRDEFANCGDNIRAVLRAVYASHFTDEEIRQLLEQARSPIAAKTRLLRRSIEADVSVRMKAWIDGVQERVECAMRKRP